MPTGSAKFALVTAIFLCGVSAACAADNWVGAWGFVPLPPPPGEMPAAVTTPALASLAAAIPLSTPLVPAAPNAAAPGVPPWPGSARGRTSPLLTRPRARC